VLELIERERVTQMTIGPTALHRLLDHPDAAWRDLSCLRMLAGTGAPVPVALAQRAIRRLGPVWNVIYGASETGTGTWLRREDWLPQGIASPRLASVGRAAPHCEAAVVGEAGQPVACDGSAIGEVMLRGPTVTPGYWRSPEATAATIRDGWFATGDLATMDADGFIHIVDRAKDVIISGGINIYPREVEDTLCGHPAVSQAAVIGLPHPEWGEAPHAAVVLRESASADAASLIAWCAERLAGYKKPRSVTFVDTLPVTASGKVLKRALRDAFLSTAPQQDNR
jgi:acyl-CoA synthetase (AMP-forming)/AMP-acid ligase II